MIEKMRPSSSRSKELTTGACRTGFRGESIPVAGVRVRRILLPVVYLVGLLLGACTPETYAPDAAPEYVIIRDATGFYHLGPEQVRGPDVSLAVQTRVKLLRREMGFSLVQLEDSRTGYVANENMAVASPRPALASQAAAGNSNPASHKSSGKSRGKAYSGPQVNDTPLPNLDVPTPDLKIQPEVVPDTVPLPKEPPSSGPKFRY